MGKSAIAPTIEGDSLQQLFAAQGIGVRCALEARRYTTMGVGGPFELFCECQNLAQLRSVLRLCSTHAIPIRFLGAGSNVIISDAGLSGCTVKLGKEFRYVQPESPGIFSIGAAMSLMSLSRELSAAGWSGLEFAGGIPASLGGAVTMNAGAHGGELATVIREVHGVTRAGDVQVLESSELNFSYRYSELPEGFVVTAVVIELVASDAEATRKERQRCLTERKRTQPLSSPSAGSVFKNVSPDVSAGYLLEQAGMKGAQEGGVEISSLHANWIINPDRKGSAAQIRKLVRRCQQQVFEQQGMTLQPEIIFWD